MTRSAVAMALLCLELLVWAPGWTAAQAHLLGHPAPDIGGGPWLNSPPLTVRTLRGRVVLVDFWTSG